MYDKVNKCMYFHKVYQCVIHFMETIHSHLFILQREKILFLMENDEI